MKTIHLLLLVLLACGFFACTTDYVTDTSEISQKPRGKVMDASSFAEFTSSLAGLGIFENDAELFDDQHGSEDFRLYIDEEEGQITVDFLTDSDNMDHERTLTEILALRPVRDWTASITLRHKPEDTERFQNWLGANFTGADYLDLRLTVLENGDIQMSGMVPAEAEMDAFPAVPLFRSQQ